MKLCRTLACAVALIAIAGCGAHRAGSKGMCLASVKCFGIQADATRGERVMTSHATDSAAERRWVTVATYSECRNRGGAAL